MGGVWADLDVNAVAGTVTLYDRPVGSGTIINITDLDKALWVAVPVDGPEVPPFMWGRGMFDTGDVPFLETGDTVVVEARVGGLSARKQVELQAGTTRIELAIGRAEAVEEGFGEPGEEGSGIGVGPSSPGLLDWAGQIRAGLGRSLRIIGSIASETLRLLGLVAGMLLAAACVALGAALLVKRGLGARKRSVQPEGAGLKR